MPSINDSGDLIEGSLVRQRIQPLLCPIPSGDPGCLWKRGGQSRVELKINLEIQTALLVVGASPQRDESSSLELRTVTLLSVSEIRAALIFVAADRLLEATESVGFMGGLSKERGLPQWSVDLGCGHGTVKIRRELLRLGCGQGRDYLPDLMARDRETQFIRALPKGRAGLVLGGG